MQGEKYLLKVNGKSEFHLNASQADELDAVEISGNQFHVLKNGKTYVAELLDLDFSEKSVLVKINGNKYQVNISDQFDQLVHKMGLSASVIHKISQVRAPMPGLVLSLAVVPGQEVVQGDTLLILEAMKMENVIKSPGEGRVKKICVEKGKAVDKGEVLIEME
jgi:biotin carboxyl carrier protein